MTQLSTAQLRNALIEWQPRDLGSCPISESAIKTLQLDAGTLDLSLELGFPCTAYAQELEQELRQWLGTQGIDELSLSLTSRILPHAVQQGAKRLKAVKNIIAIASGKGGVGKSTTAVNLALALQAEGAQAAVLDADIYGPSQPTMLGTQGKPESRDGKSMEPMQSYGVQSISIGHLVDEETPMVWRGPMATSALQQLLNDTNWREVDYLIVDLPPGTGDIQLTLSQQIPVAAAVIVTTPQDIALLDARKALKMFEKVNIPVMGIVENMSTHICSKCGHEEAIFGTGGGSQMANQYGTRLLGQLPLDISIREGVDSGRPTMVADPDSAIASTYRWIARRLATQLAHTGRDFSAAFPNIVVENN